MKISWAEPESPPFGTLTSLIEVRFPCISASQADAFSNPTLSPTGAGDGDGDGDRDREAGMLIPFIEEVGSAQSLYRTSDWKRLEDPIPDEDAFRFLSFGVVCMCAMSSSVSGEGDGKVEVREGSNRRISE